MDRGVRHAAAARRSSPTIDERPQNQAILAFLENEIGLEAMRRRDYTEAVRRFQAAIDLDARAVPAYLNLGDVRVAQGNEREAAAIWEKLIDVAPDRAYLAFDRLEALGVRTGSARAVHAAVPPADRREPAGLARAARAVAPSGRERPAARGARPAVRGAGAEPARARHPPGDLARARPARTRAGARQRYSELTRHAVFYLDPHICMRCRYRSTELLWQCPHCHDWNTFVEERIAPAQDATEVEV